MSDSGSSAILSPTSSSTSLTLLMVSIASSDSVCSTFELFMVMMIEFVHDMVKTFRR